MADIDVVLLRSDWSATGTVRGVGRMDSGDCQLAGSGATLYGPLECGPILFPVELPIEQARSARREYEA